jgi:HK97 family phage major capsid protein
MPTTKTRREELEALVADLKAHQAIARPTKTQTAVADRKAARVTELVAEIRAARGETGPAPSAAEYVEMLGKRPAVELEYHDGIVKARGESAGETLGEDLVRAMSDETGRYKGVLASGSVAVPINVADTYFRIGTELDTISGLVPVEERLIGTDLFGYMRQTVRTNNAAPVARGALKPTSVFTLERVNDQARTIAHLSEPIAKQDLSDASALEQFVDQELRNGVQEALDGQILAGDGTGENFEGILSVAGTLAQAYTDNSATNGVPPLLETTRRAVALLVATSKVPATGWVFHPNDWLLIDLERLGKVDDRDGSEAARPMLHGVPVTTHTQVPEGTGILGSFATSARIWPREDVEVTWSEAALGSVAGTPGFMSNEVVFRGEIRAGFGITRPSGFVLVDLTAA